jgi:transcriptional regulator with XRE-family HTH domain
VRMKSAPSREARGAEACGPAHGLGIRETTGCAASHSSALARLAVTALVGVIRQQDEAGAPAVRTALGEAVRARSAAGQWGFGGLTGYRLAVAVRVIAAAPACGMTVDRADPDGRLRIGGRPLLRANNAPVSARTKLFAEDGLTLFTGGVLDAGAVLRGHFGGLVEPVVDVPGLDIRTGSSGDGRLTAEHADGGEKSFLGGHWCRYASKLVCSIEANLLARKPGKIFCVDSLGELVRKWREDSGLRTGELARRIGGKVTRQHIEQLEKVGTRVPRSYLKELARAMGTTVDALMALKMPPPLSTEGRAAPPPKPVPTPNGTSSHEVSDDDFEILEAVKQMLSQAELQDIRRRAAEVRARVASQLAMKPDPEDPPPPPPSVVHMPRPEKVLLKPPAQKRHVATHSTGKKKRV